MSGPAGKCVAAGIIGRPDIYIEDATRKDLHADLDDRDDPTRAIPPGPARSPAP